MQLESSGDNENTRRGKLIEIAVISDQLENLSGAAQIIRLGHAVL